MNFHHRGTESTEKKFMSDKKKVGEMAATLGFSTPLKARACRIQPSKPSAKLRMVIFEVEGDEKTLQAAITELQNFYGGLPTNKTK